VSPFAFDLGHPAKTADLVGVARKADMLTWRRGGIFGQRSWRKNCVRETVRLQGWALMGGVGLMLAIFCGIAGLLA
jgi:hypothetical protein